MDTTQIVDALHDFYPLIIVTTVLLAVPLWVIVSHLNRIATALERKGEHDGK